ncbi:MAG: nickel pincer cofactor biosynthesis protein LarC [Clostridia bacterium]|nr:nickel pincer cofactor biosynthesis protein LarC [Clostridia bacterium]
MRILYLECNMGAAGDMLTAALSELTENVKAFENRFNALGIPNVSLTLEKSEKCGITGTHARVTVGGEEEDEHMHDHHHDHHDHHHHEHHHHTTLSDVEHIISHFNVSDTVKENAKAVYKLIAEAEAHAHGRETGDIHFHEVGTLDAIADVTAVCMLMEEINPDKIVVSPVSVGSGSVKCAHGILPVPAPATEYILRGVPIGGTDIKGELCTPTGAALLKRFADEFGAMPEMKIIKTGYGMGTKDFERANMVRAFIGEADTSGGEVVELRCNIDDMTGEQFGFATEEIMRGGALDVYTAPIVMKKNRPGTLLTVLCRAENKEDIISLIFKHTTTLGIREYSITRHTLTRRETALKTPYGTVRGKVSEGYGTKTVKAEYEDLAAMAREHNISLKNIKYETEE